MDTESINRRKCLKAIGASSATVSLFGTNVGGEKAKEPQQLSGDEKEEIIEKTKQQDIFNALVEAVKGHQLISGDIAFTDENVYTISGDNIVTFDVESPDYIHANIGISLSSPEKSNAEVMTVPAQAEGANIEATLTQFVVGTERTAKSSSILQGATQVEDDSVPVSKIETTLSELTSDENDSRQVSVNAVSIPDRFASFEFDSCETCKDFVGALNGVSCTLQSVAACAILTSETGVGPVACPVAYGLVCFIILNVGVSDPADVCSLESLSDPFC